MKLKTIISPFAALGLIASSAAVAAPVDFSAAIAASGPEVGITIVPETTDMNATYTVTGDDESGYTGAFTEFAHPATYLVKSTSGGVLPALSVTILSEAHPRGGGTKADPVVERSGVVWGFAAAYDQLDAYAEPDGTGEVKHLPGQFVDNVTGKLYAVRYFPPDGNIVAPMMYSPETVSFTPLTNAKPKVSVPVATLNNNNGPALEMYASGKNGRGFRKVVFPDTLDSRSLRVGLIAYASVTPLTSVGALVNGFALSVPGTLTVTPM